MEPWRSAPERSFITGVVAASLAIKSHPRPQACHLGVAQDGVLTQQPRFQLREFDLSLTFFLVVTSLLPQVFQKFVPGVLHRPPRPVQTIVRPCLAKRQRCPSSD